MKYRIPGTTISGFADNLKKNADRPTLDFFDRKHTYFFIWPNIDNEKGNFILLFIANNHVYNHTSKHLGLCVEHNKFQAILFLKSNSKSNHLIK